MSKPVPVLSEDELKALSDVQTADEWDKLCDQIKHRPDRLEAAGYHEAYPPDWYQMVIRSGLMRRVSDRWRK